VKLKGKSKKITGAAFIRMRGNTVPVIKQQALKKRKRPVPKNFPGYKPRMEIAAGRFSKGQPDFFKQAEKTRLAVEIKDAKKYGERSTTGALRAVQIKQKHNSPDTSKKAESDANIVAGTMKGKVKVKFPEGFSPGRGRRRR
jgi:hypothetical protein